MQRIIATILIGPALAGPAAAQMPNVPQLLQAPATGNHGQVLRDAFERGHQRGCQDEAQLQQSPRVQGDHGDRNTFQRGSASDRNNSDYRPDREAAASGRAGLTSPTTGRVVLATTVEGGRLSPWCVQLSLNGSC